MVQHPYQEKLIVAETVFI